jgi:predicted PurR-regulated permease PerM
MSTHAEPGAATREEPATASGGPPASPGEPAEPAEEQVRDLNAVAPAPTAQPPDTVSARIRHGALFRWGFFAGLGVLAALAAAAAVWSVRDILIRVVVAAFLAVSLDPAVRWLTARGVRRGVAVGLIFAVFVAILAAFLMSIIPPLSKQAGDLVHNLPDYLGSLQRRSARFRDLNTRYDLSSRLEGLVAQLPARLTGGVLGLTSQVFGALISFLTVLVFTVYFLLDLPRLRRGVVRLFTVDRRERYAAMVDIVVDKVGDYMIGRLMIAFVGGLVAFIGLELLGIPYPLPLAIFIGLLDLIPLIGHPIGATAGVLVSLFSRPLWPTTILLVVFFLVYQQVENYFIGPRILRHSVDISAVAVLLAALIGASVLGVVGALIAIPIAAAVKVILVQQIDQHEATHAAASERPQRRLRRRNHVGRPRP